MRAGRRKRILNSCFRGTDRCGSEGIFLSSTREHKNRPVLSTSWAVSCFFSSLRGTYHSSANPRARQFEPPHFPARGPKPRHQPRYGPSAHQRLRLGTARPKAQCPVSTPRAALPAAANSNQVSPTALSCIVEDIEPDSLICPCGFGVMHKIGEDRKGRLARHTCPTLAKLSSPRCTRRSRRRPPLAQTALGVLSQKCQETEISFPNCLCAGRPVCVHQSQ